MWKLMGLFVRKNCLLRCWGWLSLLNWIGALTLSLLLKKPPRELKHQFFMWSFFLLRLLCITLNQPYGHAWNTAVLSGLVPLFATWNSEYEPPPPFCWGRTTFSPKFWKGAIRKKNSARGNLKEFLPWIFKEKTFKNKWLWGLKDQDLF